jgi:hypothetical protein
MFGIFDKLIGKARQANKVLLALGVEEHTESGKQIRAALAMELLGQRYDLMDKHSKASFVKQNRDVIMELREMLQEEGVLTRKATQIEHKKEKK